MRAMPPIAAYRDMRAADAERHGGARAELIFNFRRWFLDRHTRPLLLAQVALARLGGWL